MHLSSPAQVPPSQRSPVVHALPSSQLAPSLLHVTVPMHVPLLHASLCGHGTPADQSRHGSLSNWPHVRTVTAESQTVLAALHSSLHCAAQVPFEQYGVLAGHGLGGLQRKQPIASCSHFVTPSCSHATVAGSHHRPQLTGASVTVTETVPCSDGVTVALP